MTTAHAHIQEIRRLGSRRSDGNGRLIAHLRGEDLSPIESISAKCADCQGWYQDRGDPDCRQPGCPLYRHYRWLLQRDPIGRPWRPSKVNGQSKNPPASPPGGFSEPVATETAHRPDGATPCGSRSPAAACLQRRATPFAAKNAELGRSVQSNR